MSRIISQSKVFFLVILLGTLVFSVYTQKPSISPSSNQNVNISTNNGDNNPPPTITKVEVIGNDSYLSEREYQLSLLVVILTAFTLIINAVLIFFKVRNNKPEQLLSNSAVLLIVGLSIVLITSGYSASQIAPVLGLFGTIAGYLVGKGHSTTDSCSHNNQNISQDSSSSEKKISKEMA